MRIRGSHVNSGSISWKPFLAGPSRPHTTFRPTPLPPLLDTWKTMGKRVSQKMERSYLSFWRESLKLELLRTRSEILTATLELSPRCPICHSEMMGAEMHDAT